MQDQLPTSQSNNSTILVTGGAGYIGSHAALALKQAGYRVIVLDNLVYGHRDIVDEILQVEFVEGDIGNRSLLMDLFHQYPIAAVMHFAAYGYVGESVQDPAKYYRNNVAGTLTLLQAMAAASVKRLVFSSTCAIYGVPHRAPITEDHPKNPINPYGRSKWMVEQMLTDFDAAYDLKSVCFRYFNAAGADLTGKLGEDHSPETHLIPLTLQVALGKRESVSILGADYPTPDGTSIRDYIHVADLAQVHVLGLKYLLEGGGSQTFNLSNGSGFSVRQVIKTAETVTGRSIKVIEKERRPGDPPILVGSGDKAWQVLGWRPQYPNLEDIIYHAWNWHQKRHGFDLLPGASRSQSAQPSETLPLVSVIIPAYNAETFIAKTLESVIAQTYRNLEILAVDDGSDDRTAEIVKAFNQRDPRIKLLHQPNAGVAAARNLGVRSAKGELIAPIDADDLWRPDAIAKLVAQFQAGNPKVGVVYAWSVDIDQQEQPTGGFHAASVEGDVYKTLICHNFLGNASSTLIRKACLEQVGGYSTWFRAQNAQGCEDWDLYLRLAEHYEFGVVSEFLVSYRQVASSMSRNFSQMARSQQLMLQTIQHNHPELPNYLFRLSRSSFYLYLAHQCDAQNDACATLFWLWQTIKIDPITPIGRLGLYLLLIKSLVKLTGKFWRFSSDSTPPTHNYSEPNYLLTSPPPPPLTKGQINRFQIGLKLLVGKALHRSLSRI